jgi:phage tail-like protein
MTTSSGAANPGGSGQGGPNPGRTNRDVVGWASAGTGEWGPVGPTGQAQPLLRYLPAVMARDPFVAGLVGIVEEVAGTVRADVDSIEHHLDLNLADAEMLRYLAAWIGLVLDPASTPAQSREAIRAAAEGLGWRGTRRGLEAHLTALTGHRVRVDDTGGVYVTPEEPPPGPARVVVEVPRGGHLTREQIVACALEEVPVGTTVVVRYPDEPDDGPGVLAGGSPSGAGAGATGSRRSSGVSR